MQNTSAHLDLMDNIFFNLEGVYLSCNQVYHRRHQHISTLWGGGYSPYCQTNTSSLEDIFKYMNPTWCVNMTKIKSGCVFHWLGLCVWCLTDIFCAEHCTRGNQALPIHLLLVPTHARLGERQNDTLDSLPGLHRIHTIYTHLEAIQSLKLNRSVSVSPCQCARKSTPRKKRHHAWNRTWNRLCLL